MITEIDKNYVPLVPSHVMTATSGPVTVTRRLFGSCDGIRVALEQKDLQHRAEQLNAERRPRQERPWRENRDRWTMPMPGEGDIYSER